MANVYHPVAQRRIEQYAMLRILVSFLGEKDQFNWWDCSFLNATGRKFVAIDYPKSFLAAAANAATEAARRIHDSRIGNPPTEPTNPHDAFAVEIQDGSAKLGYVPGFCNRHVNRLLVDSVPLACEVERRDPHAPPWEAVSMRVHLLYGHGNHSSKAPDFLF